MKNISVLVLASIIALSSIPVSGETAARSNLSQEKIEAMNELYKVSNVEEQMLYTMQQLPDMLVQTLLSRLARNRPLNSRKYSLGPRSCHEGSPNESGVLMEAFVLAQAEFYSVAEIQELIEFYESPIGKKFADAAPYVGPKLQQLMMPA
ncbi:MAG: hypothetical protein CM15mP68_3750 [Pseudomonadota bacterium]|nr:MAG: hypothetical protein CM15mP68_3750 [Pseudomonadota bacterium]